MLTTRSSRNQRGFSLIELLVVLALLGMISLFGFPALFGMIHRSKVEGGIREAASMMRSARLEAVRRGGPVGVLSDLDQRKVLLFVDQGATGTFATGDQVLRELDLPDQVDFRAPPAGGDDSLAILGFSTAGNRGWVIFQSDGSADNSGAFRLGDTRGNFLEIQVEPRATGKVETRKWHAAESRWLSQGEGATSWTWH